MAAARNGAGERVAVITGGSRGIGRAAALAAAHHGYRVCVGYAANKKAAHEVVGRIEADGGMAIAVRCDVGTEADITLLFEQADAFGTLGALVNNAGVIDVAARVDEMSADRLQRMMTVNVIGSFLCAREAVKRMSTRHGGKGGAIVNVSSAMARIGAPGIYVDYAAAKAAIDTMTIGLAKEVGAEGIRVNAVRPGLINTDIHESGGAPDRPQQLLHTIPMGRIGNAEEVGNPIVWLLSDQASYITGSFIDISGGR